MKTAPISQPPALVSGKAIAAPTYTFSFWANWYISTACYAELRWPWASAMADRKAIATYISGNAIHNRSSIKSDDADLATDKTLIFTNALGYASQQPEDIIEDMIEFQAHVGLGRVRLTPTGDITTNWIRSSGIGTWFSHVDEGTNISSHSDYIQATGNAIVQRFSFHNQAPSNLSKAKEIVIRIWMSTNETGTAQGLAVSAFPYISTGQVPFWSSTFASAKTAVVKHDGNLRYIELTFQACDLTKAQLDTFELELISRRYQAGGAPNTDIRVYAVDVDVWYETTDIALIDNASFDALNTYYSVNSWVLHGDFVDVKYKDAIVELLEHAPRMYIALANDSQLRALHVNYLSAESVDHAFIYGDDDTGFSALVERFDWRERLATSVILQWGTKNGTQSSPGQADAINEENYSKMMYEGEPYADVTEKNPVDLARRLFVDGTVAETALGVEEQIFSDVIDGVTIETNWLALLLLEGDSVMSLTIPEENLDAEKYYVHDVELNLDDMSAEITGLAVTM